MNERCYIGHLRLILDIALENGGPQGDKDQALFLALSKVQRSLQSSTPFSPSDKNFQLDVKDCTLLKEAGHPCTKDLEGLSSNLVFFLASESNITNHAAGKTFIALFDYLFEATPLFAFVMNFVWKVLRACFSDAEDAFIKPEFANAVTRSLCHHRISTFDCKVAMHLFQIVHGFLRKSKEEGASKFTKYLASSAVCISEVLLAFNTCFAPLADSPVNHKLKEEDLMLAALLRFLCSFNHSMSMHSDIIDTAKCSLKSQYLGSINGFLAAFSQRCLNIQHNRRLSHYLSHKFLMLMFRLREWFIKWPSLAITCSKALKSNISSLCPLLFQKQTQLLDPSRTSPFAPCLLERKTSFPVFKPERHAVFLLFKLETSMRKTPCRSVSRINAGSASSSHNTEQQDEHWMLNWLLSHVSMAQNIWDSGHNEVADCLASSFLQIFVDEDTLVLEMLLLLLDSLIPELISGFDAGHDSVHEAQNLLAEIFKPLRLFAVFLSLISYDHSVILDFLISKDTSILCLQYLMRCMHMVKNTWPEILCLSHTSYTQFTRQEELKERGVKSTIDGHTSNIDKAFLCGTVIDIDKVGTCLMDLKHAVEKLHKKHAFPYNPSPLLKHLESFEHLWLCGLSETE